VFGFDDDSIPITTQIDEQKNMEEQLVEEEEKEEAEEMSVDVPYIMSTTVE